MFKSTILDRKKEILVMDNFGFVESMISGELRGVRVPWSPFVVKIVVDYLGNH